MHRHATQISTDAARSDRAARTMTVLMNAAVRQGDRDGLCRIRNISATGLAIETDCALTREEIATVTLPSGRSLSGEVRWVRDGQAGMSCAQGATAIVQDENAKRHDGKGPSSLRFYRTATVDIFVHGRTHACVLDSISTSDILLTGTPPLEAGSLVTIRVRGLGEFPSTICISEPPDLFARFTPHLPFRLINQWLAAANR